ncbi:MAG: GTP cyclohydrolase I FolE [Candidatus Dadabacteria bacterium]|nr:MAG: GTP cyclohydrolase I FolE [Candidatus Dadabacteria bacterium]
MSERISAAENLCRELLRLSGEDPEREGLIRTPARYARAITELTSGYNESLDEIVNGAIFEEKCSEMIVVKKIEFYSLCEHHLLPFYGYAHVAYVPDGKIIGLSKIPRIVQSFARRLQVQERFTREIVEALDKILNPVGVACVVEAYHLCMMMRGVRNQSSSMVTSAMRGAFMKNSLTRNEFFKIISVEK